MIHPITPTIMTLLQVPDYLFGYSFAAMSLASFLLSPLWGKLSDLYGRKRIMAIGLVGYALGQWLFGAADSIAMVLVARILAGMFAGAFVVAGLAMVSDQKGSSAKNMTWFSTITALAGTLGYFLGGIVGVVSIPMTFAVQSLFLGAAMLVLVTFPERKRVGVKWEKAMLKEALNPLAMFQNKSVSLSKTLRMLLLAMFLLNMGIVLYDNSFNYYLKDVLQLSSAYNGMVKGIVGVTSLLLNATLVMWLIKRFELRNILISVIALSALVVVATLLQKEVVMFLLGNIVFLVGYSASVPLQQGAVANECEPQQSGAVFGMVNALRSMGGVFGSLAAGSLYAAHPSAPFVGLVIIFGIAAAILMKGK